MALITVFTPTYNREQLLPRLYRSLKAQESKDFEWVIIDDGSTDNTETLINEWIHTERSFTIRYYKKVNGGKHTAHNLALKKAKGLLFFTVDSDDWLPEHSIETISTCYPKIADKDYVAGIIALKSFPDNTLIGNKFPDTLEKSSFINLEKNGHNGERTIIFKTSLLRNFPFAEIEEEKFLGELYVYDQFDPDFEFMVKNTPLTICEYQKNGLSSNFQTTLINNPIGTTMIWGQRIDRSTTFKERFGYAIRYHIFYRFSKRNILARYSGKHKTLVRCCFLPGFLAYIYYRWNTN